MTAAPDDLGVGTPTESDAHMTTQRLVAILVMFLVVSAVASPVLAMIQEGTGSDPDVLRLTTIATAVGAIAVWVCWPSSRRVVDITKTDTVSGLWFGVVLALVLLAVLALLNLVEGARWPLLDPSTLPAPLAVVLGVQILGAAGEEMGWRGVVQPLLERRFSILASGGITGLLFGLGHFYVLPAAGALVYGVFVISATGLSVCLAVLTAGRALIPRIAVATSFHWLVNSATLLLFSDGDESLVWTINTAVATAASAVAAVLVFMPRDQA